MGDEHYDDFDELDVEAFKAWRDRYEAERGETVGGWHTVCEPPVFSICRVGDMARPENWLAFVEDNYPGETEGRYSKRRYYVRRNLNEQIARD